MLSTPTGDVPPLGSSVALPFAAIFGEREGKVAFHHAYWENATFMAQITAPPE